MLINLTEFFAGEGSRKDMEVSFERETISFNGDEYRVIKAEPAAVHIENMEQGKAKVVIKAEIEMMLACDRCLKDVPKGFVLDFETELVSPERATEDELFEESMYMEGYQLNTDDLISNEIFTCWPAKILCREDCKGLCKVCGKDLNEGECGCDTFVPDPRMAAVMDIFRENKEV